MHDGEVIMVELRGIDGSRTDLAPSPPRRAPEWRLFNPYVRVAGLLIVDEDGVETEVSECGVVYERPHVLDTRNTVRDGLILERGEAFKKIPWYRIQRVTARGPDAMTVSLRDGTSLDPVKLASGTLTGTDGFGLEFQLSLGCVRTITPRLDTIQAARTIPAIASRNAVTPPPAIHRGPGHPLGRKLGLRVTDAKGTVTELLVFGVDYMPFSQSSLDNAVRDYLIIDRGRGCLMIRWDQMERMGVPSHDSTTIVLLDGRVIGPVKLRWGSLVGTNARGRQFVFGWEYARAITVFLR